MSRASEVKIKGRIQHLYRKDCKTAILVKGEGIPQPKFCHHLWIGISASFESRCRQPLRQSRRNNGIKAKDNALFISHQLRTSGDAGRQNMEKGDQTAYKMELSLKCSFFGKQVYHQGTSLVDYKGDHCTGIPRSHLNHQLGRQSSGGQRVQVFSGSTDTCAPRCKIPTIEK